MSIVKPNWDVFKAKFSENPEEIFEWFCYLLFCNEHHMPKGIFRYKNQSAIETEPIKIDDKVIGWQAKLYNAPLSKKSKPIIETIVKANRDYPNLTELIFYTNQEWGQGKSGKNPKGKVEAEEKAKELGIHIEWRVASFFESEFVSIKNSHITKYFFTQNSNIEKAIANSKEHTNILLQGINTSINFNGKNIEIDRDTLIQKIKNTDRQVIVLNGGAGTGKTALIKKIYKEAIKELPFYILKATEFSRTNLNTLFTGFTIDDLIDAHVEEKNKILVIDSAEKLLDITDDLTIKKLLSILIKNNWKIIFTTRYNYLNDLNHELKEVYQVPFENISINDLTDSEFSELSRRYNFDVPTDSKLRDLIKNPFYLSQYLKYYQKDENLSYLAFKNYIWEKSIAKNKPSREQCFLEIANKRAMDGTFFVKPNCELNILDELRDDNIIGYESHGYFIIHDIYEEWALEKIIETTFSQTSSYKEFLTQIGDTLPIRRSFRKWISEKLLLDNKDIYTFIEEILFDSDLQNFWKDEIFISILLSDYADTFFVNFERELLKNNFELLKRVSFLLRLACKEADSSYLDKMGIKNLDTIDVMSLFSKPKGKGWKAFIDFIYLHLDKLGLNNINWVVPVLSESVNKLQSIESTKRSSLIALKFYKWINEEKYYHDTEQIKKLCLIIINGSLHIKDELKAILDEIFKNRWKYHSDKYHDLSKIMLSGLWGTQIANAMPKYILKLANLFWRYTPKKPIESPFGIGGDDSFHDRLERAYGIEKYGLDDSTASAYQTPIYNLLKADFKDTIDFILNFVNESVEIYSKSEYAKYLLKVKVNINEECIVEQYHDMNLWGMYREINSSPILLQSIHMALEKYLLEIAKDLDDDMLEKTLIYILQSSISSSISAVVASIVLAYPDKTFNVAKILLKTKEFIIYDFSRYQSDRMGINSIDFGFPTSIENRIFEDERKQASKDEHRLKSLENICLLYQLFRSDGISEEEAKVRQSELWKILDNYYKDVDSTDDKTWEMTLVRMDRRKMDVQLKKQENGYAISFNPELSDELKEYSETAQEEYQEKNQYLNLDLWARYKLDNDDKYKQYQKYESNPKFTFKQLQEVLNESKNRENILYKDIPINVSLILLRDYQNELSDQEKVFCKDILLDAVEKHSNTPKAESIISFLPYLMREFHTDKNNIKKLLFKLLCLGYNLNNVWDSFEDANSMLIGYLILKPKYISLWDKKREEYFKIHRYADFDSEKFYNNFMRKNKNVIERMLNNTLSIKDIQDYSQMDNEILIQAFNFLPENLIVKDHKDIAQNISSIILLQLLANKKEIDFSLRSKFIKKFALIISSLPKEEIANYLQPFIDNFNGNEIIADFFVDLILIEDQNQSYGNFWYIWELFQESIIKICEKSNEYWDTKKIIKAYFLAYSPHGAIWRSEAKEWSSLKEKDVRFLKSISLNIGHCPSVLYSISTLLTSIASGYTNMGIEWLASILKSNQQLLTTALEPDTVFNIEILMRKYALENKHKIKKNKKIKNDVLEILNFLVERGSAIGYMLRERVV